MAKKNKPNKKVARVSPTLPEVLHSRSFNLGGSEVELSTLTFSPSQHQSGEAEEPSLAINVKGKFNHDEAEFLATQIMDMIQTQLDNDADPEED